MNDQRCYVSFFVSWYAPNLLTQTASYLSDKQVRSSYDYGGVILSDIYWTKGRRTKTHARSYILSNYLHGKWYVFCYQELMGVPGDMRGNASLIVCPCYCHYLVQIWPNLASHADVLRLVTRSFPRGEERVTSLRTSAWEARPNLAASVPVFSDYENMVGSENCS